jgi:hypothetical protein
VEIQASPVSLKFGRLAISSKGGASALAWRWSEVTTWHAAHHRCASRSPFKASAAWTGITTETNPKAATQNAALVMSVLFLKQVPNFFIASLDFEDGVRRPPEVHFHSDVCAVHSQGKG